MVLHHTHTHTHSHTHTRTHTHIHTHTHRQTHTYTHTHTNAKSLQAIDDETLYVSDEKSSRWCNCDIGSSEPVPTHSLTNRTHVLTQTHTRTHKHTHAHTNREVTVPY